MIFISSNGFLIFRSFCSLFYFCFWIFFSSYSIAQTTSNSRTQISLRIQHDLPHSLISRLDSVLNAAETLVQLHFEIPISFKLHNQDYAFNYLMQAPHDSLTKLNSLRIDTRHPKLLPRLSASLERGMLLPSTPLSTWWEFLSEPATHRVVPDFAACPLPKLLSGPVRLLANLVAEQHLCWQKVFEAASLQTWVNAPTGAEWEQLKHEYRFWQHLAGVGMDAEVFITRSLIASTEIEEADVHSSLRGGISNGLTFANKRSRTGGVSILSLAPFFDTALPLLQLRGETKPYTEEETVHYAALMLTHELGHQLLRLGHPWGNKACVMRPPVRLHFRAWAAQLNPAACRLSSEPAMTPRFVDLNRPAP